MDNKKEWFLCPAVLRRILYFESDNGYSLMVMKNRQQEIIDLSLNSIEAMLPVDKFSRVHRSYLVNMEAVSALRYYGTQLLACVQDYRIPVSRRKGKALLGSLDCL